MAETTLKTRIVLNNKTSEEWASSTYNTKVPLKGEMCIYSDLRKVKIGDGTTTIANLAFANLTPEEIQTLIQTATDDATAKVNALANGQVTTNKNDITTIKGQIQAIQESAYDDTEVRGLITTNANDIDALEGRATAVEGKVTTLIGSDANKSVRKIANEELAAQLIPSSAKESLDTLAEIAAWIQSHPDDASAMNEAIDNLETLVGTLPSGIDATTIVGYIQEVLDEAKSFATGEVTTHASNTTLHITAAERTNWNAAKTHADSAHAPADAEKNQNAFSNVVVGSTTIAADSATDSLTIAAGTGITVAGDATNDKVTITNAGVRSISTGSANGTISVDTNGSSTPVAVKGLDTAAYHPESYFALASHGTHVTYATANPLVAGTAAVGTSAKVAREDHVHPAQTSVTGSSGSCTGNSATATTLQTARTIGATGAVTATAASFNGSANVNINITALNAGSLTQTAGDVLILDGTI